MSLGEMFAPCPELVGAELGFESPRAVESQWLFLAGHVVAPEG